MTALKGAPLDGNGLRTGEACHAMESIDALLGETFLALSRHGISKAPLERDQIFPIDAQFSLDAAPTHPAGDIDRLRATDQHFLGIAAAQRASPTERTVIDDRDRLPRLADASRRHLRGGTGADNDEVIAIHVLRLAARAFGTGRRRSVQDK
jgi:hypothetical protein